MMRAFLPLVVDESAISCGANERESDDREVDESISRLVYCLVV